MCSSGHKDGRVQRREDACSERDEAKDRRSWAKLYGLVVETKKDQGEWRGRTGHAG